MTEQPHETSVCINCNNTVATPYCSQCGQPNPPHRMSLGQISADIQGRAYGTSGLFQRTLRDLFIKPGRVVATYIAGNRVMYSRPVGFFLLMTTIMLVLISVLNIDYSVFLAAASPTDMADSTEAERQLHQTISSFMVNNLRLMSFVMIPIQAFIARWFFFRKRGFSYLEHTVLPFYSTGQLNVLGVVNIVLFRFTNWMMPFWLTTLISIIYFAYGYSGWIVSQHAVKVFLKGIGIYLVSLLFVVLLSTIGMGVYLVLHPEMLNV